MGMIGMGNECYLYVNGISVSKPIWLHDTVCISPAKSAIKWKEVMPLFENDIDFSIAVLCNPTIASQLHMLQKSTAHLPERPECWHRGLLHSVDKNINNIEEISFQQERCPSTGRE